MTRQEMWQTQYRSRRYLEHVTLEQLSQRVRNIMCNMMLLIPPGEQPFPLIKQGFSLTGQGFRPGNPVFRPPGTVVRPLDPAFSPRETPFPLSNQGLSLANQGFSVTEKGCSLSNQGFSVTEKGVGTREKGVGNGLKRQKPSKMTVLPSERVKKPANRPWNGSPKSCPARARPRSIQPSHTVKPGRLFPAHFHRGCPTVFESCPSGKSFDKLRSWLTTRSRNWC